MALKLGSSTRLTVVAVDGVVVLLVTVVVVTGRSGRGADVGCCALTGSGGIAPIRLSMGREVL